MFWTRQAITAFTAERRSYDHQHRELDRLAEAEAYLDVLRMDIESLREQIIPEEVKKALADLDTEFFDKTVSVNEEIEKLKEQIKQEVVEHGETVNGAVMQAVFVRGSTSWDTKKLDGYVAAHPEVEQFRSVGSPSVSLRKKG